MIQGKQCKSTRMLTDPFADTFLLAFKTVPSVFVKVIVGTHGPEATTSPSSAQGTVCCTGFISSAD